MNTIVAISTAPGIGGIGIIRLSGKESFNIIKNIFIPKNYENDIKGYSIKYGHIKNNKTGQIIDEVLVSYFIAPNSYTREDMCEINSHGGNIVMQKIVELCLENGAVLAAPGEFTKRAFLNGRIDLSQAESVIDIINAKTQKEAFASVNQLDGFLSQKINEIEDEILDVLSDIEANIDYPEYDIEQITTQKALDKLVLVQKKLESLNNSFEDGKILKEGIKTVIIGRPNAGKSSLLNAILREERAIVTEYEGTTRDTIEEFVSINGIPIKIIDTAGIREANDEVEKIGVVKAKKIAKEADLIIAIFDSSSELNDEDKQILKLINDRKAIIVLNKIDKSEIFITRKTQEIANTNKKVLSISALNKKGIEQLYETISDMFRLNEINIGNDIIITNIRHKNLIMQALEQIVKGIKSINNNMPIDIIAINIKEALERLGQITGKNVTEDIVNKIFSKFCLGK